MAAGSALASSRLRRMAQTVEVQREQQTEEHCDLCGARIGSEHRHLVDLEKSSLMCACQACKILFDRGAAGGGHYRLVPDRRLRLDDLKLDDPTWERLRVPVDMAFFYFSTPADRVLAFYPSPMGATTRSSPRWRPTSRRCSSTAPAGRAGTGWCPSTSATPWWA